MEKVPIRVRSLLKVIIIEHLHQILCELFRSNKNRCNQTLVMESYDMDSKVIQFLIQGIIETGDYTLEGIAYHTRIPFDVIYDAAGGLGHQLSVTLWISLAALYLQVKPNVAQALIEKLIEIKNRNSNAIVSLLAES